MIDYKCVTSTGAIEYVRDPVGLMVTKVAPGSVSPSGMFVCYQWVSESDPVCGCTLTGTADGFSDREVQSGTSSVHSVLEYNTASLGDCSKSVFDISTVED